MGLPVWRSPSPPPRHDKKKEERSPIRRSSYSARRNTSRSHGLPQAHVSLAPEGLIHLQSLVDQGVITDANVRSSIARSSAALPPPPPPPSYPQIRPLAPSLRAPLPTSRTLSRSTLPINGSVVTLPPITTMNPAIDSPRGDRIPPMRRMELDPITGYPIPRSAAPEAINDALDEIQARTDAYYGGGGIWSAQSTSPLEIQNADNARRTLQASSTYNFASSPSGDQRLRMRQSAVRVRPTPVYDENPYASRDSRGYDAAAEGLGDRLRSPSASDEWSRWDTMLTTITPDENLPSADSSFTSAAASASFSAGRSHTSNSSRSSGSSGTAATEDSQSLGTGQMPYDVPCDSDEEGIDTRPLAPPSPPRATAGPFRHHYESLLQPRRLPDGPFRSGNTTPRVPDDSMPRINDIHSLSDYPSIADASQPERGAAEPDASTSFLSEMLRRRSERERRQARARRVNAGVNDGRVPPYAQRRRSRSPALRSPPVQPINAPTLPSEPREPVSITYSDLLARHATVRNTSISGPVSPVGPLLPRTDSGSNITSDNDLDAFRSVIGGLASRTDIPDEWWQSVGLSPSFAGRVERTRQDRERRLNGGPDERDDSGRTGARL